MLTPDAADVLPVAVAFVAIRADIFVENELGEVLFRPLAERLRLLRRVNAREPHFVLHLGGVQHRDRVAV